MWRFLYSMVFHLCLPLILARLWWRGKTEAGYRHHIGERFGLGDIAHGQRGVVWIHAVSVGEVRAAVPLIGQLRAAFPAQKILVTVMTPTGRRTARDLLTHDIAVAYLPYDLGWAMRRVIDRIAPAIIVIMETELWPNLIASARQRNIPTFLVNARLSEKSYQRYAKFAPIKAMTRDALQSLTMILAQSANDAERFRSLGALGAIGAHQVEVTGNMKFDLKIDDDAVALGACWRAALNHRPVILLASTRDNEEGMLAEQFQLVPDWPSAWTQKPLLVVVPRHPSRFDDVCTRLENNNFVVVRRSQLRDDNLSEIFLRADVLLGDSMGEMQAYYAMCNVAIIGGSFQPLGGQNLIEAAALAKPVIIGPSTFNFSDAVARAKEAAALIQVKNAKAAIEAVKTLLTDETKLATMGGNAKQFAAAHRGATGRTMAAICKIKAVD